MNLLAASAVACDRFEDVVTVEVLASISVQKDSISFVVVVRITVLGPAIVRCEVVILKVMLPVRVVEGKFMVDQVHGRRFWSPEVPLGVRLGSFKSYPVLRKKNVTSALTMRK